VSPAEPECSLTFRRRPQYKTRFHKWQLHRTGTLPNIQEVHCFLPGTTRDQSVDWPIQTTPIGDVIGEAVSNPAPSLNPDPAHSTVVEHNIYQQDNLPSSADRGFKTDQLEESEWPEPPKPEEVNAFHDYSGMPFEPLQGIRAFRSPPILGRSNAVSTRNFLNAMGRHDILAMLTLQDIQNVAEAAHFLFAIGSYQNAHLLYIMLWKDVLTHKDKTIPLLVSAVVNVARSSYNPFQSTNARIAIKDLMHHFGDDLKSYPTAEYTLRAQLADVLRKLNLHDEAIEHCGYALGETFGWGYDSGHAPLDNRGPGFLLHQCSLQLSKCYNESATKHDYLYSCGSKHIIAFRYEQRHYEILRVICVWCAARLLDEELQEKMAIVLCWRHTVMDDNKLTRELGTLVFCHIWAAYVRASKAESDEDVSRSVSDISELMGISVPEIFATLSLTFVNLEPCRLTNCKSNY
jgi:hypothetical protein